MKFNIIRINYMSILIALLITVIFIYSYTRPFVAAERLEESLKANNLPNIEHAIDYVAVKENLRHQLRPLYKVEQIDQNEDMLCNTIKTSLDNEVIDLVLDQWLSLDNLKTMFLGEALKLNTESSKHYLTVDTVAQDIKLSNGQTLSFIYHRSGLMVWRLSEIQLSNLEGIVALIKSKQANIQSELKKICVIKVPTVNQLLPQVKSYSVKPKQTPQPKQTKVLAPFLPQNVRHHMNSALTRACQLENKLRSQRGISTPSRLCSEY